MFIVLKQNSSPDKYIFTGYGPFDTFDKALKFAKEKENSQDNFLVKPYDYIITGFKKVEN